MFSKLVFAAALFAAVVVGLATANWSAASAEAPAAAGAQPIPQALHGSGSRVLSLRIPASSPLVVTGRYVGSSNFIVHLVGQGNDEGLFNVIGTYNGQAAVDTVKRGVYRVAVEAEGSWSLTFAQPRASSGATRIPGTLRSSGSRVVQIQTRRAMQPIITADYRGSENFIVHLIGIGDTTGVMYLFNEIGPYHGQTLADSTIPAGHYLLWVQADAGSWSISIKP
jgi:hypothetical protein